VIRPDPMYKSLCRNWRRVTRYNATQWEGNVWLRRRVGGKAIGQFFTESVCVFTAEASGLF
jgi:hypothetical protein